MVVKMPHDSLPSELDPSLLHLNDPECGVLHSDERKVVLKIPLEGCGTVRRSFGEKVSFLNNVVVPSGFGNKRSFVQFPFKCSYKKFGLGFLGGVGDTPKPFYRREQVMDTTGTEGTL